MRRRKEGWFKRIVGLTILAVLGTVVCAEIIVGLVGFAHYRVPLPMALLLTVVVAGPPLVARRIDHIRVPSTLLSDPPHRRYRAGRRRCRADRG